MVYGISADDVASHAAFRDKYQLDFPLLADTDHAVCEAYGVWKVHPQYGPGVSRETFVIGPDGNVVRHDAKVSPASHAGDLLGAL